MTSFGSRDLKESHPNDRSFWMRYVPLAPSLPHPLSGVQLLLKNGELLEKDSYIQRVCYEVRLGVLAHYDLSSQYLVRAKNLKLTKGSLKKLLLLMPDAVPWGGSSVMQIYPAAPVAPVAPLVLPKHNKSDTSTGSELTENLSENGIIGFDVQLIIREKQLDDGTFEKLLRLCKEHKVKISITSAIGSDSTSVFGPAKSSHLAETVVAFQQKANGVVGLEDPSYDLASGYSPDESSREKSKLSLTKLLELYRMIVDFTSAKASFTGQ